MDEEVGDNSGLEKPEEGSSVNIDDTPDTMSGCGGGVGGVGAVGKRVAVVKRPGKRSGSVLQGK